MAKEATLADVVEAINSIPPAADESYFIAMRSDIEDLLQVAKESNEILEDIRDSLNGLYDLLATYHDGQRERHTETLKALEDINETTGYLVK